MTGKLYEGGFAGCLGYLFKRALLLGAKLLGFKGFCLFLSTLLLCAGRIGEDVWLTLAVTLVCSASGIRVLDSFREGTDALDAKQALSERLSGRSGRSGGIYEAFRNFGKDYSHAVAGGLLPALPWPGGGGGFSGGSAAGAGGGPAGADGSVGADGAAGGGTASGAARRAAGRKAGKASRKAAGGLGAKGRERIREVLEEASRCIE